MTLPDLLVLFTNSHDVYAWLVALSDDLSNTYVLFSVLEMKI